MKKNFKSSKKMLLTQCSSTVKQFLLVISRAVSAALHTPQLGGTLPQEAQNLVPSPLSPPEKASMPQMTYEAVEISEVKEPLEKKSAYALQLFWAPLNARYLHIRTAVTGLFESKAAYLFIAVAVGPPLKESYFTHYGCKGGPLASASLAFLSTYHCI